MTKVLIADALSPRAVEIFRERGLEVDVKVGLKPDALKEIIGGYDGLAVRSATKVTRPLLERALKLKVIGRAGIGVDNIDVPAATQRGIVVMNTPYGNSITTAEHAIALERRAELVRGGRREPVELGQVLLALEHDLGRRQRLGELARFLDDLPLIDADVADAQEQREPDPEHVHQRRGHLAKCRCRPDGGGQPVRSDDFHDRQ